MTTSGKTRNAAARTLTALALAAVAAICAAPAAMADTSGIYKVGIGVEPINPCSDGTWPTNQDPSTVDPATCGHGGQVYLGGFGFGGPIAPGTPAQTTGPEGARPAQGVLRSTDPYLSDADGAHVRAMSISAPGGHTLLVADIEVQGWFASDKQPGVGLVDIRKAVATQTGVSAENIFVQSDHTHAGADALGVWGGVPPAFMTYMANQTIKALVAANKSAVPTHLVYGSIDGRDLLHNQFDQDPANQTVDSAVRVLQARNAQGNTVATLLNFSAHADFIGSHPYLLSGDWLAATNALMEQRFGGRAMTLVATVGRTQPGGTAPIPTVSSCGDPNADQDHGAFCRIESYGTVVVDRAAAALSNATPLAGPAQVASHSYLITDPATSALILGLDYAGSPAGVPIYRALTPPWLTGTTLGTVAATARIGDVLLSSGPGEMYPQIALKVADTVTHGSGGIRPDGFMTAGLSNDQLGYIIAPFEAYPQPIERSMFSNPLTQDVISGCISSPNTNTCPTPSPISNDNYFFNVSHTMGERLTCALLRGADDVLHSGSTAFRDSYSRCALFPNDAALPPGSDLSLSDTIPRVPVTTP